VKDAGRISSILPDDNLVRKPKIDRSVLRSADWLAAKELSDIDAADRLIERLWTIQKTGILRFGLKDEASAVFISVPSTSGANVLALRLGLIPTVVSPGAIWIVEEAFADLKA
jgi:hypothetical protein